MTWISLVCLLALSSTAFGRSAYGGGYGTVRMTEIPKILPVIRDQTFSRPILPTVPVVPSGYGQDRPIISDWSSSLVKQDIPIPETLSVPYGSTFAAPTLPKTLPTVSGYGGMTRIASFDQPPVPIQPPVTLTPADLLCRGQRPETVIPFENNRKFVVCLDDSKGVEQECPKGLYYHETSRRCERKLGPLENVCASQPCLNGGQCVPTDFSYQCQCAPGFDGRTCELDARICQTQYPCGQSPDARCQSFRLGAALQYMCILQDGVAYGLNAQQVQSSPCQSVDGPFALAVSNKGFIMCDGERMFVESCPGGTIWDDSNKACVWPDMQTPQLDQGYGQYSYGSQRTFISKPSFDLPRPVTSYGSSVPMPQLDIPKPVVSYGSSIPIPQFDLPKPVVSYGSSIPMPQLDIPQPVTSYGGSFPTPQRDLPRPVVSYGSSIQMPQLDLPKTVPSYGGDRLDVFPVKQISGY